MTPQIAWSGFAIILVSWFGGVRYQGIPAGLVAIAVGMIIAWARTSFGLGLGRPDLKGVGGRFPASLLVPIPALVTSFSASVLGVIL